MTHSLSVIEEMACLKIMDVVVICPSARYCIMKTQVEFKKHVHSLTRSLGLEPWNKFSKRTMNVDHVISMFRYLFSLGISQGMSEVKSKK